MHIILWSIVLRFSKYDICNDIVIVMFVHYNQNIAFKKVYSFLKTKSLLEMAWLTKTVYTIFFKQITQFDIHNMYSIANLEMFCYMNVFNTHMGARII